MTYFVITSSAQLRDALKYREEHPGAWLIAADFWAERALEQQNIPFVSLRTFSPPSSEDEEWWVRAQDIAREWYRLPEMASFTHDGVRIGEALEPMLEMYLSRLLQYVRFFLEMKEKHPDVEICVPDSEQKASATAGPLATFEGRVVADAARMVRSGASIAKLSRDVALFPPAPRAAWILSLYNAMIRLLPRRPVRLYASEYWSHISAVMDELPQAEVVLMERGEFANIPWNKLIKHRVRFRHPSDILVARAQALSEGASFTGEWENARTGVEKFLKKCDERLDWSPVLEACEHLVRYAPRVVADYEGLRALLNEENPAVVLQRASIGGRQHHFFLLANIARQLHIPSVELQHAGAVFDARSVHSRLGTTYLAAYGAVEREEYAKNGYGTERIVVVGSPRFDAYARNAQRYGGDRESTLRLLGLHPRRRTVLLAVPNEQFGLSSLDFSSYDIADFFRVARLVRNALPDLQFIFKFRADPSPEKHAFIRGLFPDGGVAVAFGDPVPLLQASDIVTVGNSTMMYEAMLTGRPLILYPWKPWDYHLELYRGAASYARTSEELINIIKRFADDAEYVANIVAQGEQFLSRHAFDGKSAVRTAEFIQKLSARKANKRLASVVDLTHELNPSKEVRYEARKAQKNGVTVSEVPFSEFKDFYAAIVPVKKSEAVWDELGKTHRAYMAKKENVPVSAAAFLAHDKQVYYSMAVTDFDSPYAAGAGYLLQIEVMKMLKEKGYALYVVGVLAEPDEPEKLQQISAFKKKLGHPYFIEGDSFPFASYTPVTAGRRIW